MALKITRLQNQLNVCANSKWLFRIIVSFFEMTIYVEDIILQFLNLLVNLLIFTTFFTSHKIPAIWYAMGLGGLDGAVAMVMHIQLIEQLRGPDIGRG